MAFRARKVFGTFEKRPPGCQIIFTYFSFAIKINLIKPQENIFSFQIRGHFIENLVMLTLVPTSLSATFVYL